MKKIFITITFLFIFINYGICQESIKPEYFGIYAVVNGKLVEFVKDSAVKISGVGNMMTVNLGIKNLRGPWLCDSNLYFIVYGVEMKPILSLLTWKSTVNSENPMTGAVTAVPAEMWVANGNIEFKVAPFQGLDKCYKYIPSKPLKQGYYCLHTGRLTSSDAFDMTIEANAKKDAFDFAVSSGFMLNGDLSKCDIDKGQFIKPAYYGLSFIENKKYVLVPVSKGSYIVDYGTLEERKEGLLNLSTVILNSASLEKSFISYSEQDARKGLKVSFSNASFKDMVPEKMFLSKLKQIDVDSRSKREIKKLEPEKIVKVWVEDVQIPYFVDFSAFYHPRIARLFTEKPLEPGVYALHNGALKGQNLSFGFSNVIYSFTVK